MKAQMGRYSCTLSLTSALDGGEWSTPRPGRFTPGKYTRYSLYRRPGGPQGRSAENLAPTGIRSPDRPGRSESLYRLHYLGPVKVIQSYYIPLVIFTKKNHSTGLHSLCTEKSGYSSQHPYLADPCFKSGHGDRLVGWGTSLRAGRSRVRFPMVSLEFFIDIILPAALWPLGRLSLQQKWVPGIFPGVKAAGA
jgi:hypothetical protein